MRLGLLIIAALTLSCQRPKGSDEPDRLVFVYQPLGGDPKGFESLLARFAAAHPEVKLETQLLPNASDVAHQYFVTSLEGGSHEFDVFVVDVVWVPEFARAGWIADLSAEIPPDELRRDFLPGPVDAVVQDGRTWAVPWYVDVGLLYYRSDLVPRAPRTYAELTQFARDAQAKDPLLQGYVWQGRQYEGLICNVYERVWGFGGEALSGERLSLASDPAEKALASLRELVSSGVSPPSVMSAAEEETRRAFQSGRAVFMRNWPYAWGEAQSQASPVKGKVAFAPLPTESGEPGWGTLGGWQLAVNANSRHKDAAVALIRELTSERSTLELALAYGRNPARRAVYLDPKVKEDAPFISQLLPIMERARPRPVTPYYGMLSDALQGEFSAAVSGIRSPKDALERAQAQADRLTGEAK